jgi:uncharacterized protein YggE
MIRFFAVSLVAVPALAQQLVMPPAVPYVRVHGDAVVSARPDRAQLDIGVISHGDTSQSAANTNAKQSGAVIEQLRAIVPRANITTVNFSVNPNYEYPKDGGPPVTRGYTANNTVRITIDDMSALRKAIDVATRSGASNVNRLNFLLRDEAAVRAEALGKAAVQAQEGAQALAASLKLKLGRVLRVEEEQPVVVSPAREVELPAGKTQRAEPAPVEPGQIEIHASVTLTFELIQQN